MKQVSPDEITIFEEIKSFLGDDEKDDSNLIAPFPLLTKNAVESLRYRSEVIVLIHLSFMVPFVFSLRFHWSSHFFRFLSGPLRHCRPINHKFPTFNHLVLHHSNS